MTTADETPAPYGWVRRGNVLIYPGNLDADYDLPKLATPGRRRRSPSRKPIPHGEHRGYIAHKRRGEPMCDDCYAAARRHWATDRRRRLESA